MATIPRSHDSTFVFFNMKIGTIPNGRVLYCMLDVQLDDCCCANERQEWKYTSLFL